MINVFMSGVNIAVLIISIIVILLIIYFSFICKKVISILKKDEKCNDIKCNCKK